MNRFDISSVQDHTVPMKLDIIRAGFGCAAYRDMIALRHRVLREPLGLVFTEQQLAAEKDQVHLALRHDSVVIGTLLLVPPDADGIARLRQMAIDPCFERQGLGRLLLRHGEDGLRQLQATRIALAARERAVGFYARLGYVACGEPFIEVTLPHLPMMKQLQACPA